METGNWFLVIFFGAVFAIWFIKRLNKPRFSITATIVDKPEDEISDEERLARWQALPEESLSSDEDPTVQFLIDNKGQDRTIRYYGKYRKVHVVDVIEKEGKDFPYLKAEEDGELRTFSFEHITLPERKKKPSGPIECPQCHIQRKSLSGPCAICGYEDK